MGEVESNVSYECRECGAKGILVEKREVYQFERNQVAMSLSSGKRYISNFPFQTSYGVRREIDSGH